MSGEGEAAKPTKGDNQAKLPVLDPYAKLSDSIERQNQIIDTLAKAVVALNQKVEGLKSSGGGAGGGEEFLKVIRELAGGTEGGGMSMENFVKTAENMARAGAAIDNFRNLFRISPAEAMLMRAGLDRLRHPMPRYMTKEEIRRYEKLLGVEGALEGLAEQGEEAEEHVKG